MGEHNREDTVDNGVLHAILSDEDAVSALSRHLGVVVLEISRSGCLLEGPSSMASGALAMLRVTLAGVTYSDAVRVIRTQPLEGAGDRQRIGVEFAWLFAPDERSLRRLASRISTSGGIPLPLRAVE